MKRLLVAIILLSASYSYAANRLSYVSFDGNYTDPYGYTNFQQTDGAGPASEIITYVAGYSGQAARTSHNDSDDRGADLEGYILHQQFPSTGEFYVRFYLKMETGFSVSNWKWLWSNTDVPHTELIFYNWYLGNRMNVYWQMDTAGGHGFAGGTDSPLQNSPLPLYSFNSWMKVEVYMKRSSGAGYMNPDGICWVKLNDTYHIYDNTVVTGEPNVQAIPGARIGTASPGAGWWQIDEYEIWDGIPDSGPPPTVYKTPMSPMIIGVVQ